MIAGLIGFGVGMLTVKLTAGPVPLIEVTDAGRKSLETFRDEVDKVLVEIGTPPSGAQGDQKFFHLLPEFRDALTGNSAGTVSDTQLVGQARVAQKTAAQAADALDAIQISVLTQGQPTRVMDEMYVARNNLTLSLRQYEEIAKTVEQMTEWERSQRKAILPRVLAWQGQADELLQSGYSAYLAALERGNVVSSMAPPSPAPSSPAPGATPSFQLPSFEIPTDSAPAP